ncbi:MFS transporter [Microlunatus endophyticus]|uniref:MFS transporter n=1 Tax=Microlunatus endophyticus TaxID=1716077 RepID=A0A917S5G1_9ACTN|nr:MFS transporter [Microlunatus endophyticus]GGL59509.1 MFS transporter [Microlunatus endophyticus]
MNDQTRSGEQPSARAGEPEHPYWKRNLAVGVGGSFTTLIAMTLLLPYLPLYIEQLGVTGQARVTSWAGITYSATFVTAGLTAPIWGRLGDRYGRKSMLVRASLGMAIVMSAIGLAQDQWQLLGLRLIVGLLGGYSSGATILVAAQAPERRRAWALGVLSSGIMAGNIAGPLLGGIAPALIGIRNTFFGSGALIFLAFLATVFLIKEDRTARPAAKSEAVKPSWADVPDKPLVLAMLGMSVILMIATLSVEPIVTVYVRALTGSVAGLSVISGVVFALSAAGSIISAPWLGRLADRVGRLPVLVGCLTAAAILLGLQALAGNIWVFGVLRFAMGLALGGLMPTVTATLRSSLPDRVVGRVLGYNVSAQYVGQVIGPILGGFAGGHFGIPSVFVATAVLALIGAGGAYSIHRSHSVGALSLSKRT